MAGNRPKRDEWEKIFLMDQSTNWQTFAADEVLAKHDERYMPKEVAEAVKRAGLWQEGGPKP